MQVAFNEMAEIGSGTNSRSKGEDGKLSCRCDVGRHVDDDKCEVGSWVYEPDTQK